MRAFAYAAAILVFACGLRAGAPVPIGPPPGGAGPGAGEEKEPTPVVVSDTVDTLYLHDGGAVTGTVVAVGLRAVVLVEKETGKERTVLRSEIERVERDQGPDADKRQASYPTGDEEGLIVINPEEEPGEPGPGPDPGAPETPKPPAPKVTYDPAKIGRLVERLKKDPDAVRASILAQVASGAVKPEAAIFFARLAASPVFEKAAEDPDAAAAEFMRMVRGGEVPESALRVLEGIGAAGAEEEAKGREARRGRAESREKAGTPRRARRTREPAE